MSPWIKNTIIIMLIAVFVEIQWICCKLSPQHAEFLKIFFWEFPIALFKAWVPGL